jgi:hypothetical protein
VTALAVDTLDPTWRLVVAYAEERIRLLSEQAVNLEASDKDRDRAAARVAELRLLQRAPERARQEGEAKTRTHGATY